VYSPWAGRLRGQVNREALVGPEALNLETDAGVLHGFAGNTSLQCNFGYTSGQRWAHFLSDTLSAQKQGKTDLTLTFSLPIGSTAFSD